MTALLDSMQSRFASRGKAGLTNEEVGLLMTFCQWNINEVGGELGVIAFQRLTAPAPDVQPEPKYAHGFGGSNYDLPTDPHEQAKALGQPEPQEAIRAAADEAETFPGSGALNWGEIPFKALAAWVERNPHQTTAPTADFDVESVKGMFADWWKDCGHAVAAEVCEWRPDGGKYSTSCGHGFYGIWFSVCVCGKPIREVRA